MVYRRLNTNEAATGGACEDIHKLVSAADRQILKEGRGRLLGEDGDTTTRGAPLAVSGATQCLIEKDSDDQRYGMQCKFGNDEYPKLYREINACLHDWSREDGTWLRSRHPKATWSKDGKPSLYLREGDNFVFLQIQTLNDRSRSCWRDAR